MFESLEAKAAILLIDSLPESMNNIVDNLQTKKDLTYEHIYSELLDLKTPAAISSVNNKVYKSTDVKRKGNDNQREPPQKGPLATTKECSFCKKHFPTSCYNGYTWNVYTKLKAPDKKNKEKKTVKTAKIGKEETPNRSVHYPPFAPLPKFLLIPVGL